MYTYRPSTSYVCAYVLPLQIPDGRDQHTGGACHRLYDDSRDGFRTMQRDQASAEQVQAILLAQAKRDERLRHAHDVLVNDRDLHWLQGEVERLHHFYLTLRKGQP